MTTFLAFLRTPDFAPAIQVGTTTVDELAAEVDCAARRSAAAAPHSNANLVSVSRRFGSFECLAMSLLSCANHSNTLAMSIGPPTRSALGPGHAFFGPVVHIISILSLPSDDGDAYSTGSRFDSWLGSLN